MAGNFFANQFYAYFDNEGYVVATDYTGSKRVGVSLGRYSQMQQERDAAMEKAEKYLKMLYDAKVLTPELTPDEKINVLTEQVSRLTAFVEQLVGNNVHPASGEPKKEVIVPEIVNRGNGNAEFVNNRESGSNFVAS